MISLSGTVANAAEAPALVGKWVMHLYLGDHLFDDVVEVKANDKGVLGGTLAVPDRFTAELKNVISYGSQFRFEITADEGRGPFTVHYEGTFYKDNNTFVGFATLPGNATELLGGFVGQRR